MNYLSYQDEKRRIVEEPSQANFATVVGVYEDGLQLQFDGETESSSKKYRYNQSITFKLGDRVKVTRVSGTYVAEYPIGKGKFSVAPDNVSGINATAGETEVSIQWSDPADKTVDGQLVSKWAGTYLVRNESRIPVDENDGTVLVNNKVKDTYKTNPFIDSGLVAGKTYYYNLFPYSDEGKVNRDYKGFSINLQKVVKYGIRIDQNNSDPDTAVTYLYDAVGKKPAKVNLETGEFDYGDWADVGFVKDCKPCMLRYDGTVDYYLNPNDYSKKEDGTPSDFNNPDYEGNAMVEFPLWYFKHSKSSGYGELLISNAPFTGGYAYSFTNRLNKIVNKMYIAMYPTSQNKSGKMQSIAKGDPKSYEIAELENVQVAVGESYAPCSWSQREYIAALLMIMSKSLNTQEKFGWGPNISYQNIDYVSSMFFGMNSTADRTMNVFHIRNWWGDPVIAMGAVIRGTSVGGKYFRNLISKSNPPYDYSKIWSASDYTFSFNMFELPKYGKYLKSTGFFWATAFNPTDINGSENTYYCSYCDVEGAAEGNKYAAIVGESRSGAIGMIKDNLSENNKYYFRLACTP